MSNSPSFVARFTDDVITRMTVSTSLKKLDVERGVRLAQWAYRSRMKREPPSIVEAKFVSDDATLASYDAAQIEEALSP